MAFQPIEGKSVAIIGGGIAGVIAAQSLSAHHEVVLFDFGSRGLGGRCGHREDHSTRFDHGAQFLSVGATDSAQWRDLISSWVSQGLLEEWKPRLLEITPGEAWMPPAATGDSFFDVASATELYVSPGGMRNLCEGIAGQGHFQAVKGCRVRRVDRGPAGQWILYGNPGNQAHHEASNADAQAAEDQVLGSFKAIVLTDVMLSFPTWHRAALLGLEALAPDIVQVLRDTEMAPLFSLMVSFEAGATEKVPLDAAVVCTSDVLQWLCRMNSKAGSPLKQDCWVCVSTRGFAEACLKDEPMSVEGSEGRTYRPQEKDYLCSDPADRMLAAFLDLLQLDLTPLSKQCQRWGAAYVHQNPKPGQFSRGNPDGLCLVDARDAPIAACGDFLSAAGPRGGMASAYSAAMSALAAADALTKVL